MTIRSTRRTVLATGAAALCAGCSESGNGNSGSSSAAPSASGASSGTELAKTTDIPVEGGKIFKEQKVVVTQPQQGDFKCFSAICTHLGCTVNSVSGGTIICPCHGSRYRIADASVVSGPAPRPLPEEKITVTGNSIRLA